MFRRINFFVSPGISSIRFLISLPLLLLLLGEERYLSVSLVSASTSLHHRSPLPLSTSTKIAGAPVIRCEETRIRLAIRTTEPFGGNVYAKGYFHRENCRVSGNGLGNSANITIPVNSDCGMRRRRSVNPQGIVLEMTVIVMFHNKFLTQNDRAFKLECIYVEINQQLRNALTIADMPASELNDVAKNPPAMPKCTYEVLNGKENGMPVTFATLGQPVYHKWSCRPPGLKQQQQLLNSSPTSSSLSRNMVNTELEDLNNQTPNGGSGGGGGELPPPYCLTVHSCDVDDGQGNIQRLVDGNGCSTDAGLFGEIAYDDDGLEAWRVGNVFKFADHPTVYFSCQIRLVLKRDIAEKCERAQCIGVNNNIAAAEVEAASGITSEGSSGNAVNANDVLLPLEQTGTGSSLNEGGGQKRVRFQQHQKQNNQNNNQKPMSSPSFSVPTKNSHLIGGTKPTQPLPASPFASSSTPPALQKQQRRGGSGNENASGDRGGGGVNNVGSPPAFRPPTARGTTTPKKPTTISPSPPSTLSPTLISSTVTVTPNFHSSDSSSSFSSTTASSDAHSSDGEETEVEEETSSTQTMSITMVTNRSPSPPPSKLLTLSRRTTTTTTTTSSSFAASASKSTANNSNNTEGTGTEGEETEEEAVGAWNPLDDDNTEEDNTGNKSPAIIAFSVSPTTNQQHPQQHSDNSGVSAEQKTPEADDGDGGGAGDGEVQRYGRSSSTTHHTVASVETTNDDVVLVLQRNNNNQNSGSNQLLLNGNTTIISNKKWREPLAAAEQRRSSGGAQTLTKDQPPKTTKNKPAKTAQQHEEDLRLQKGHPNQSEERREKTGNHKKTSSTASSSRANSSSTSTNPVPALSVFELDVSPVAVDVLDAIHPVVSHSFSPSLAEEAEGAQREPKKSSSSGSSSAPTSFDSPLEAVSIGTIGGGQRFDVLQSATDKKNVCVSSMFLTGALLVTGLALGAALSAFCCFVWCRLKDPWALFTCRKRSSRHREAHLPHREAAFWAGVARPGRQQHRPTVSASANNNNNNGIHFC